MSRLMTSLMRSLIDGAAAVMRVCLFFPQDFVMGLSILLRGTVQEKLNWAFNLYDINKDGYITKEVGRGRRLAKPHRSEGVSCRA